VHLRTQWLRYQRSVGEGFDHETDSPVNGREFAWAVLHNASARLMKGELKAEIRDVVATEAMRQEAGPQEDFAAERAGFILVAEDLWRAMFRLAAKHHDEAGAMEILREFPSLLQYFVLEPGREVEVIDV
jgi:hypothetical protein